MLKAIFFDAAGTLIYLPCSVGEHYRNVALRFGADIEAALLDRAFRQAWKASPPRASTPDGSPRPDDDKGWWRALVTQVLDASLPRKMRATFDADAYFEALYTHFNEAGVWAAFEDTYPALERLRRAGMRLGVISNFDRRLYPILEQLNLAPFFERIVISSEAGVDKPDPLIFRRALEMFGVSANKAMHVGDDPVRDWGAEALGMRVFRLERPGNSLQDVVAESGKPGGCCP